MMLDVQERFYYISVNLFFDINCIFILGNFIIISKVEGFFFFF